MGRQTDRQQADKLKQLNIDIKVQKQVLMIKDTLFIIPEVQKVGIIGHYCKLQHIST